MSAAPCLCTDNGWYIWVARCVCLMPCWTAGSNAHARAQQGVRHLAALSCFPFLLPFPAKPIHRIHRMPALFSECRWSSDFGELQGAQSASLVMLSHPLFPLSFPHCTGCCRWSVGCGRTSRRTTWRVSTLLVAYFNFFAFLLIAHVLAAGGQPVVGVHQGAQPTGP